MGNQMVFSLSLFPQSLSSVILVVIDGVRGTTSDSLTGHQQLYYRYTSHSLSLGQAGVLCNA